MVEPEKIFLRTGLDVIIQTAIWFWVLTDSICALGWTVETYTLSISLVIVDRTPFQRITCDETIWLRTVVVVELEDVVQTQRHHIVDTSFARSHHHHLYRLGKFLVLVFVGLYEPFVSNLFSCKRRIPCQSAESIPISLRERMTAPVGVITDIGYTWDSNQSVWINKAKEFLPHRSEIGEVLRLTKIFLLSVESVWCCRR